MQLFTDTSSLLDFRNGFLSPNVSIGFVPTMGALHDGHLELVAHSTGHNDITIVSIFVNPLQFNNAEDLTNYPRNLDADCAKLERLGVDAVFAPHPDDFYKEGASISIHFGALENVMEGKFRPMHFSGVGIVLTKLFHLIRPTKAYFGLKDIQQFLIVSKMVEELAFPIEIIGVPTYREPNGLAMSSRNIRLSSDGKNLAANLYQALLVIERQLRTSKSIDEAKSAGLDFLAKFDAIQIEYVEIAEGKTLQPIETLPPHLDVVVCIAAYVEGVRLIDNLYLRLESPK